MIISVTVREDLSARYVSNSRRCFATWTASEVGTLVKSDTTSKDTKDSSWAIYSLGGNKSRELLGVVDGGLCVTL